MARRRKRNRSGSRGPGPEAVAEVKGPSVNPASIAAPEIDGGIVAEAQQRWDDAWNREHDNQLRAYEDLDFRMGVQWDPTSEQARLADGRPCLTFNKLPPIIAQVTGDIRQMRPGIKVVGVDDRADKGVAEILEGMIRYVETRSDANHIYYSAADSQVTCGIGHWRVITEYAADSTFEQELAIELIDDAVGVLWDPDAKHPTRKDARFCFIPVDMSREKFKELYPNAQAADFGVSQAYYPSGWIGDDYVRVAEYWVKRPFKRKLAKLPDGGLDDLTNDADAEAKIAQVLAAGGEIVEREAFKIVRHLLTAMEELEEPQEWPGRYIPIVPVIGQEVRSGRRRYRHGLVRFAKDAQRAYNYANSTQVEVVALQPKTPWIGTVDMFKDNEELWQTANMKNWPYLIYRPDRNAPGAKPERAPPPVASSGFAELLQMAAEDIKGTTGIFDASLGAKSNETSGRAILARQREGDNSTFVYISNFSLSIQHTARILVDLIPHIYDTARTIRVIGEDGKVDVAKINQPAGIEFDGEMAKMQNDVTVGAYDVSVQMGPSYTTRREEAREGMLELLRGAPQAASLILDLVAQAQDWPLADKIAKRLRSVLPPQIAAMEAMESGEEPPPPPPPPPPDPSAEAEVAKSAADVQIKHVELEIKQIQRDMELAKAAALMQPGPEAQVQAEQIAALMDAMDMISQHIAGMGMPQAHEMAEPPGMEAMEGAGMMPEGPPMDAPPIVPDRIEFNPEAMPPASPMMPPSGAQPAGLGEVPQ